MNSTQQVKPFDDHEFLAQLFWLTSLSLINYGGPDSGLNSSCQTNKKTLPDMKAKQHFSKRLSLDIIYHHIYT